jgi:SpoVK/Ycf46/Vps4 family AAA+-type ATPase
LNKLWKRIEAASPCVCYFDEFDKFFMANNSGSEDSETKQVLGVLLTWLQEKQSQTFVIATLNRLDALPPELTRAGRFDKIFYVGFPQAIERKQIFQLYGSKFDLRYQEDQVLSYQQWQVLLGKTQNCTGAEIRAIVENAARKCFHQGREILLELDDLLAARELITPLYIRDTERVLAMENRAKGIAESASSIDQSEYAPVATSLWGDKLRDEG